MYSTGLSIQYGVKRSESLETMWLDVEMSYYFKQALVYSNIKLMGSSY